MPSFDIVSELNTHELENAINIAKKELLTRFDFKGSKSEIRFDKKTITLLADDEFKLKQLNEILVSKLIKRGVSSLSLDYGKEEPAGGMMVRQLITLKEGIDSDNAKKITKLIKESKLKVNAQLMDDIVRVTGKKIDDLQEAIALVKQSQMELPLQFVNMRS